MSACDWQKRLGRLSLCAAFGFSPLIIVSCLKLADILKTFRSSNYYSFSPRVLHPTHNDTCILNRYYNKMSDNHTQWFRRWCRLFLLIFFLVHVVQKSKQYNSIRTQTNLSLTWSTVRRHIIKQTCATILKCVVNHS